MCCVKWFMGIEKQALQYRRVFCECRHRFCWVMAV
ncbi:hypothetical protein VPHK359_0003 [Vibrio phage K359]